MNLFDLMATISIDTGEYNHGIEAAKQKMSELSSAFVQSGQTSDDLAQKTSSLAKTYDEAKEQVEMLAAAYDKSAQETGEASEETQELAQKLKEAEENAENLKKEAEKLSDGINDLGDSEDKASKKTSIFGEVLKANLTSTAIIEGVKKIGSALVDFTKQAIESYAQYEQLVGGVETLFGNSANKVIEYANNAYKTAGMSANAYMETVTSFSASLIQGLGGDTAEAARIADMAITDMSDNSNKMGTSMSSIQDAYQGFAKQNYTMLDNLKLGYGGTQEEMIRLINDSGVLNEKISSLDGISFDTIISAIHAVQDQLGITGTTAEEASSTIEGSLSSAKAAWDNLLTGLGDSNADIEALTDNFVESAVTAVENIIPVLGQIVLAILEVIGKLGLDLLTALGDAISSGFEMLNTKGAEIVSHVAEGISGAIGSLIEKGAEFVSNIVNGITSGFGTLNTKGAEAVSNVVSGISGKIGELLAKGQEIVTNIKNGIEGKIGELIQSGSQIISRVISGIKQKFSDLIQAGRNIIAQVKSGITAKISEAVQWGRDLIDNFVAGITGAIGKVVSAASSVASTVKSILGFSEPEEGPLSDFHTYAPDMMQLFAEGIMQNIGLVKNAASSVASALDEAFTGNRNIFIRLDASGYESTKRKILSGLNLGTASVDFASSGLGVSSAGIVNGVSSIVSNGSGSSNPITINLMLPDGTKMASYLLGPLANYANANGTPILNPT